MVERAAEAAYVAEFERRQEGPLPSTLAAVLQRCGVSRETERVEAAGAVDANLEDDGDGDDGGDADSRESECCR